MGGKQPWCPRCGTVGLVLVFDPGYDGRRMVERECHVRGEVVTMPYAMCIAAHCVCPKGRWLRGGCDPELLPRIPDLFDVLEGRSRWVAEDPTGETPGSYRPDVKGMVRRWGAKLKGGGR